MLMFSRLGRLAFSPPSSRSAPLAATWAVMLASVFITCGSSYAQAPANSEDANQKPRVLLGHPAPVYAAAFTPDGKILASGGFDQKIKLWNVQSGQQLTEFAGHTGLVLSLAVSPDGHTLVSGGSDNTIRMWDIPSDLPLQQWAGHEGPVHAVALSTDGKFVLSAGADHQLRVWEYPGGKLLQTLAGHEADIRQVAISANRLSWASADDTGRIRLWTPGRYLDEDPTTGLDLFGHLGPVTSLSFHPNNQQLLTSGADGTVKLWQLPITPVVDVVTSEEAAKNVAIEGARPVELVEITPAGTLAVTAGSRSTLETFNPLSPAQVRVIAGQPGAAQSLAISRNAALIATGNEQGVLKFWNQGDGADRLTLAGHQGVVQALDFHPDNARLLSAGADGTVRLWRLPVAPVLLNGHTAPTYDIAATKNGQFVVTVAADQSVRVWSGTGAAVRTLAGHQAPTTAVAIRADDAQLASADSLGVIRFWNTAGGQPEGTLGAHTSPITDLAYHPATKSLVATAADGSLKQFELPLVAPKLAAGHTDMVHAVDVSADGTLLVSGSTDQTVRLFNMTNGALVRQLAATAGPISAVAFNPDSSLVAAGNDAGRVLFRKTADAADLLHVAGHAGIVTDLHFHPSLPQIATAGADGTIRIWELPQPAKPLAGHTQPVRSVAASADGTWYATSSDDKTVKLWKAEDHSLLRTVNNLAAPVGALDVRQDGLQLAAADDLGRVHLIKVADGSIEHSLGAHTAVIRSVQYDTTSSNLLTVAADGTAQVWKLKTPAPVSLAPHVAAVSAVELSPDGKTLVTGDAEGNLQLLPQPATPQTKATPLAGQRGPVTAAKFSSNSAVIVSASSTGYVQHWDPKLAKMTSWLQAHGGPVGDLALHPDPQTPRMATVGEDGSLRLWNLAAQPEPLDVNGQQITTLAITTDGKRMATAGTYQGRPAIVLRDLATDKQLGVLLGHEGPIASLAFSGSGLRLASGSADGSARVWDLNDPKFPQLARFNEHQAPVTAVALNADGTLLASGANNNTLKLFSVADQMLKAELAGHTGPIADVVFAPNGANLISAAADKTVRWWNPTSGAAVRSVTASAAVTRLAIKPDGAILLVGTADHQVLSYNVASGQPGEPFPGHSAPVTALTFSPDGLRLASRAADGELRVWQTDGKLLEARTLGDAAPAPPGVPRLAVLTATPDEVLILDTSTGVSRYTLALEQLVQVSAMPLTAVTYTTDGQQLLVAGADKLAKLINVQDGTIVRTFTGHQDVVTSLALQTTADQPQAAVLLTGSLDKTVRSWKLADGAAIATWTHPAAVRELALSGNGRRVSVAGEDGILRVIDLESQHELERISLHVEAITAVAISPDGTTVISGGMDKAVRSSTLASEGVTVADAKELYAGQLLGEGTRFATIGAEPVVRIWPSGQAETATKPIELAGSATPLLSLATSPDGTQIAAGSTDNKLHVWNAADAKLLYSIELPATAKAVAYADSGAKLVVASDDLRVRVLQSADGSLLDEITTAVAVKSLATVPGSRKLITNDTGNNGAMYTTPLLRRLAGHEGAVNAVRWTVDGKALVSGGADKSVRVWDLEQGESVRTLAGPQEAVRDVTLSADGQQIVASSQDGKAYIWNTAAADANDVMPVSTFEHAGPLHAAAFSPDHKRLATSGEDGVVHVWDLETGPELERFFQHTGAALDLAWAPDNRTLVSAGLDKSVQIMHVAATRLLKADPAGTQAVAFLAAGEKFATTGADGTVRIWPESGEPEQLPASEMPLTTLAYDPAANVLVAGGADQKVYRWDMTSGEMLAPIETPAAIQSLSFNTNPEQPKLAVLGADEQVRVYDPTGRMLERMAAPRVQPAEPAEAAAAADLPLPPPRQGVVFLPDNQRLAFSAGIQAQIAPLSMLELFAEHEGEVTGVKFSLDGNQFLTSGADHTIRLWNLADGTPVRSFVGSPAAITHLALSRDGKQLFATAADNALRVWPFTPPAVPPADAGAPAEALPQVEPTVSFAHESAVQSVSPTVDGSRVATTAADGVVRLWDVASGMQLERFVGHPPGVTAVAIGADSRTVVSVSAAAGAKVARTSALQVVAAHAGPEGVPPVRSAVYSSNGALILSVGGEVLATTEPTAEAAAAEDEPTEPALPEVVKVWDTLLRPSRTIGGAPGVYTSLELRSDNAQVVAGMESGQVAVWKFNDGAAEFTINTPAAVRHVAYSPDRSKLLITGADGQLRIFNVADGQPLDQMEVGNGVQMARFTLDNRHVITSADHGLVDVWRFTSPTAVRTLTGHGGGVYGLHFNPDATRLASCSADATIRLWNTAAGNQLASLTGHVGQVSGIDFSPDGALLASCGQDQTVRLWDVAGARQLKQLAVGDREIYSVSFSADGKFLATGGVDKQIRTFDVLTGQLVRTIAGHEDFIYRVAYSPVSTKLLSCGYSGQLAIWNPSTGQKLFEYDLGEVAYNAVYTPDGTQALVPAADGRLYFVDIPAAAR